VASAVCYVFVAIIKPKLGYDDSLDAFGIHGVGGIVGAIGTGIVYAPGLGGPGGADFDMGAQIVTQVAAVGATIVWASLGTIIAIAVAKALTGLRVTPEIEREGLDLGEHGERAYNS
jgi:ammonium transporter, Amt family